MSTQSIIEHKANMYYLEFREDYLAICLTLDKKPPKNSDQKSKASPYCQALILAIMENWTNHKRGKHEDPFIYMSYPQWINAMYGLFGRNVIADSLDELVYNHLLKREPYRMFGKDSYKYKLEADEVNRRMRELPARDPNAIHPDPVISKPEATRLKVNASQSKPDPVISKRETDLQVNATRLKVNEDPVKKGRNIESTIEASKNLNKETEERETPAPVAQPPAPVTPEPASLSLSSSQNSQRNGRTLIAHPLHSFLFVDDALAPTILTVRLTSKEFESELEDDRRCRIAQEVSYQLELHGHPVTCRYEREIEQQTVDAKPAHPILDTLTDEQLDFWRRWCGLIGCDDTALSERLLPDVRELASKVTTTADLESLYQSASAMLLEFTKAAGKPYTPPHLKNLVKHYATWKTAQDAKQREREQASTKAVPGSGTVQNWTTARLAGKMVDAPPIVYDRVERKPGGNMDIKAELTALRQRLSRPRVEQEGA